MTNPLPPSYFQNATPPSQQDEYCGGELPPGLSYACEVFLLYNHELEMVSKLKHFRDALKKLKSKKANQGSRGRITLMEMRIEELERKYQLVRKYKTIYPFKLTRFRSEILNKSLSTPIS